MTLELPDGFRLIGRESRVDIFRARELLLSKKRRSFTSALRRGDEVTLTRHVIECPWCRAETPACLPLPGTAGGVTRRAVSEWSDPQYSLFERERGELILNAVRRPDKVFDCPNCGQSSGPFQGNHTVRIGVGPGRLSVSCRSADLKGLLSLARGAGCESAKLCFPLTETLSFDLRSGRSSLRVADRGGEVLAETDVTRNGKEWRETTVYKLLEANDLLKRKLRAAFARIYEGEIPFPAKELSPLNAVAMTRFQGFPRIFYDAIPYDADDGQIEPSFAAAASGIRRAQDLPAVLESSALPGVKSLKRAMFSTPGLFFYLPELETLWPIFGDVNVFTGFLESEHVFAALAFLHQYPGAADFLRDYREEAGSPALLALMKKRREAVEVHALRYAAMGPDAREKARASWKRAGGRLRTLQGCSIPMPRGSRSIRDCVVDGYSFEWLRTRSDYVRAGRALRNCLTGWSALSNPVVAVKRSARTVAAIEVAGREIVQARAACNLPLSEDEELAAAYGKWKEKNALSERSSEYDFED